MTMRIFVPRDAGAVAVGADEVARTRTGGRDKRGLTIEIIRTGSRGLYWLEPMVEVATAKGRVAYGPVTVADALRCSIRWRATARTPCGRASRTKFPG